MPFKHGRLFEVWLNEVDVTGYIHSVDLAAKVGMGDVTTGKASWRAFLSGVAEASLTASGYFDSSELDQIRETLQEVTAASLGQLTYFPAGAVAIGDPGRLLNINSTDYKTGSHVFNPISMAWTAMSTAPVGIGTCLAPLAVYGVGAAVALTGDGLLTSASSATGLIAHLHVTALTGGDTHTFKLQDATTIGGVYTDIASAAFVNVTATGSQRLVVPGTIRQFVRLMYTVAGHSATFGLAAART